MVVSRPDVRNSANGDESPKSIFRATDLGESISAVATLRQSPALAGPVNMSGIHSIRLRARRGGPRSLVAEVEEQDLALLPCGDRDGPVGDDASAVAGGQNDVAQRRLPVYELKPRAPPARELMDHMPPGIGQGRVDHDILAN